MAKSLFPEEMINTSEMTIETIASKFSYFFEQIHLTHLQTPSHAEHVALNVWQEVVEAKDAILERLMGYEGRKIKAYKIPAIVDYTSGYPSKIVGELKDFAQQLQVFADGKRYGDISNLAQDLSGKAAQTLYLLTQS
jgi:hypothetical protein